MKRGKFETPRKYRSSRNKTLVLVLSLVLVMGFVVGGTLAWLTAETDEVKNTFTYGDINITLDEADVNDEDNDSNTTERVTSQSTYKMIPGTTLSKDPTVTVEKGSEACWLFVKVEKSTNFDSFMEYSIAEGWEKLTTDDGSLVYFRSVASSESDQKFAVLKDNQVEVKNEVKKDQLNALDTNEDGTKEDPAEYPTLTFTAYAVQKEGFVTAAAAWAEINK